MEYSLAALYMEIPFSVIHIIKLISTVCLSDTIALFMM